MGTGDEANAGIEFSSDFGGVLANMHKYIFFFFFSSSFSFRVGGISKRVVWL